MALVAQPARLRADIIARLDALIPLLPAAPGSPELTRSDALRAAVEEGVRVLEERYGRRTKARKGTR